MQYTLLNFNVTISVLHFIQQTTLKKKISIFM